MTTLSNKIIIGWDVYNWSGCLPFWLNGLNLEDKKVLALGEREGGLSLFFASQGSKVVCSDFGGISQEVIAYHQQFTFAHKISYADVNVFTIPFETNTFDIVVCKSVIGGLKLNFKEASTRTLENQKLALVEIKRVLKPGGFFLGAENMKGACIIQKIRERYKNGKVGWRHLGVSDLKFLLADFSSVQVKYFGLLPGLFRVDLLNRLIHILNKVLNIFLKSDNKYISFIKCQKAL